MQQFPYRSELTLRPRVLWRSTRFMIPRRDFLVWAATGVSALAILDDPASAQQPAPSPASAPPAPFSAAAVVEEARLLAKQPHKAPSTDVPAPFANLTYDQYIGLTLHRDAAIWAKDNVGFAIEPLARGFIFTTPVALNVVEDGVAKPVVLTASAFDFGKLQAPAPTTPISLSGFRVLQTHDNDPPFEVALFQGATFMRAVARGQRFGLVSRALSIRTADPKGEDFPFIRTVWIERPSMATPALVVHALIDSETMTGAYRFTLRPGDVTIVDTECTLFARAAVDNYGLGGTTAMFLFNAIDRRNIDDVRSAVCDSSGLQMLNGKGEWIWRPASNRETLQVSAFVDTNPGGFGLLQRERGFAHYQDDDQHWELRPSLWIEPIGDWGEGSVQLVEIPTDSEVNDNIICFWRPKAPVQPGAQTVFAYRQFWCWSPPTRPPLAIVTTTRGGKGATGKRRRFIVEFTGDIFANDQSWANLKQMLSASVGTITSTQTFYSKERKTCRVLFELDPGSEGLAEMRLVLEQNGKPVSETWLYRWTA
ncbi:glucan biosynthesis protein [Lichenifustis flavocetrariae]|uniref:Glucan biosynthesis protein n=1 Tax=Lichenifustis flavocetrariae TaxID=2949735 RepID=A0AA41Z2I2_9HYPH|nr:glucan biosynthesis protein [Lichenifustis flavocetrariae]MCW6511625.1 glucan biosynthesis protein [Lichenifustis flavocetrariae]